MTRHLNIVVTCTKRKTCPVDRELKLGSVNGSTVNQVCRRWIERLRSNSSSRVEAEFLYSGDQWKIAASLPQVAAMSHMQARLWVCSAGYGLIPATASVQPYSATFSQRHPDSIRQRQVGEGAGLLSDWWSALATWEGPAVGEPRTLQTLVERDPKAPLIVVASPVYLAAMRADLDAAVIRLANSDLLTIISAGVTDIGSLQRNVLPCDGRLQAVLGGALMSLNVRVARRLLESPVRWPLRCSQAATIFNALLQECPELVRYDRSPMSDTEVREFIHQHLMLDPSQRHSPLLRRLRDDGNACEQKRFRALFQETLEAIGVR